MLTVCSIGVFQPPPPKPTQLDSIQESSPQVSHKHEDTVDHAPPTLPPSSPQQGTIMEDGRLNRQISQLSESPIEEAEEAVEEEEESVEKEDEEGQGDSLDDMNQSGSCSSLVEALAAATAAKTEENKKADEKNDEQKTENGLEPPQAHKQKRRNSLFNRFHKSSREEDQQSDLKESVKMEGGEEANTKPKLRQTVSLNPAPVGNLVSVPHPPVTNDHLQRAYVSEGDLAINNTSNKLSINTDEKSDDQLDAGHHLEPPASAPPVPTKNRRDSLSFVRKMSKKIRHTMTGNKEGEDHSSEEDILDKPDKPIRPDRPSSRKGLQGKVCLLQPKFELIDLTMEDVPYCPPIRKCHYVQHVKMGMSFLLCLSTNLVHLAGLNVVVKVSVAYVTHT